MNTFSSSKKDQDSIAVARPTARQGKFFGPAWVQPRLRVGSVNDPSEKEADELAEKVIGRQHDLKPEKFFPPAESHAVRRKCNHCVEEEKKVQRKVAGTMTEAPASVDKVLSSGSGKPLEPETRAFFEKGFNHDFSRVRLHDSAEAAKSAEAIEAMAYTSGNHIVFNRGMLNSGSLTGRKLIAHELVHVMQQGGSQSGLINRRAAPVRKKTVWVNVGFDSSARADEKTIRKLRASIAAEKAAMTSCCSVRNKACNVVVKVNYDWNRVNKPAPSDNDYDNDSAADRALRDRNLDNITTGTRGIKVLVTESTLSQTWQGVRIFPRANTGDKGVLWNPNLAADDTIAHEAGHAAGYVGDIESHAHSSDPSNLMSPGSIRNPGATPDEDWCNKMEATAV